MPRLPHSLIYDAARISRHLPKLLRECRDLPSAVNELRWMKQAILKDELGIETSNWTLAGASIWQPASSAGRKLQSYVKRRAAGEPLQYILGTQPFGELEILCRSNVLIPRWETEVYTSRIAQILQTKEHHEPLRIADICSGSGCIALLLHSLLKSHSSSKSINQISLRGYDISEHALHLAHDNLKHNLDSRHLCESAAQDICFEQLDILSIAQKSADTIKSCFASSFTSKANPASARTLDVIVSNPPYISPKQYAPGGSTTRSVRKFEPKLALVPPPSLAFPDVDQADQFYIALLRIASATSAQLLVMEVGDTEQAIRVAELCQNIDRYVESHTSADKPLIEIWKDDGSVVDPSRASVNRPITGDEAECRAVVAWFDHSLRQ